jgi:hypothetical protein
MGYVLELLPKTIINNGDTNLLTEGSVTTFKNAVNPNIPLENQVKDLARRIGDTQARISTLEKDKATWEGIIADINQLYDNKYGKDRYLAIEKYGALRSAVSDFRPQSQTGDRTCDWFWEAACHLEQSQRVMDRRNYARGMVQSIISELPILRDSLKKQREDLAVLQVEYAKISNQKISEIKTQTDLEIAKQKAETEKLAQQQAPLLAAQRSRTQILTFGIIGGVALLIVGGFLLRNK